MQPSATSNHRLIQDNTALHKYRQTKMYTVYQRKKKEIIVIITCMIFLHNCRIYFLFNIFPLYIMETYFYPRVKK